MNVLIVDDEMLARSRLRRLLSSIDGYTLIAEAADANQAMKAVRQQQVDIVLLDIQMPGQNGLRLAADLRALSPPPAVILVTAHPEHALDAYSVSPVDYLLKPVDTEKLRLALSKAGVHTKAHQKGLVAQKLSYQIGGVTRQVDVSKVYYFSAEDKYVKAVFAGGTALLETSLRQLERKYAGKLERIHRNTLINWQYFDCFIQQPDGKYYVRLKDCNTDLDVSRREASRIKHLILPR